MGAINDTLLEHARFSMDTNWRERCQQKNPRLTPFLEMDSFMTDRKKFDRVGAQVGTEKTDRKGPTRITNVDMDLRWATNRLFELANLLAEDDGDTLGDLVLPNGAYIKGHSNAYHRACDQVAVDVALGPVLTGVDGATSQAFEGSQTIAHGGTGLTLAKLLQVNEMLEDLEVCEDDGEDGAERCNRVCVYTARQMTNLLNTTEIKSTDYNTVKALAQGTIDTFMGFKFKKLHGVRIASIDNNTGAKVYVRYGGLPKWLDGATTVRTCAFWVKGAVLVNKGPMNSKIAIRSDLSDSVQTRSTWKLGGTRIEDEGVIAVNCVE
jgi:hypothetical protein